MFERPKHQLPGLERIIQAARAAKASNGSIPLPSQLSRENQGKYLQALIDLAQQEKLARSPPIGGNNLRPVTRMTERPGQAYIGSPGSNISRTIASSSNAQQYCSMNDYP
jgi:hypothetical protein